MPAVSATSINSPSIFIVEVITSRVVPATAVTIATAIPKAAAATYQGPGGRGPGSCGAGAGGGGSGLVCLQEMQYFPHKYRGYKYEDMFACNFVQRNH